MKIILSSVSIILLLCLTTVYGYSAESAWEKIETRSEITLYERWVTAGSSLIVKERKGEMLVKSSMKKALNVLTDPAKTQLWMENVDKSYMVRKLNDLEWYSYTSFALPWPFDNRDLVCHTTLNLTTHHYATLEMSSSENIAPYKENFKRLTNYKATWKIVDVGNGYICVVFSAVTFKAPEYPRIIQDKVVRGAFLRSLINLRIILASK
ncbi:MAG: hypothetical protein AB9842_02300 [Bacteroidales bacterium]